VELRERLTEVFPLFGLRVRTPRLELRYADDEDLLELGVMAQDIHGPDERPFAQPWNQVDTPAELRRGVLSYSWARRAEISPKQWSLTLVTVVDAQIVGMQGIGATDFAGTGTVSTGSWLNRAHQGQGIGPEMRAAVLHLAFAGLDAVRAESGAYEDNPRSLAVSRKVGYRENGDKLHHDGERRRREVLFAMDREDWEPLRRNDIELVGVEACLPLLVGPQG
jgi:RimJ/RimL family protein N-acetyltransferase